MPVTNQTPRVANGDNFAVRGRVPVCAHGIVTLADHPAVAIQITAPHGVCPLVTALSAYLKASSIKCVSSDCRTQAVLLILLLPAGS